MNKNIILWISLFTLFAIGLMINYNLPDWITTSTMNDVLVKLIIFVPLLLGFVMVFKR